MEKEGWRMEEEGKGQSLLTENVDFEKLEKDERQDGEKEKKAEDVLELRMVSYVIIRGASLP